MYNIKFSFLYRDAANYKTFSEVVFANRENIPLEVIRKTILNACNVDGCIDPRLWNLPNIRTQPYDPELDHDWYVFENVEEIEEEFTEPLTLSKFLQKVKTNPLSLP